MGDLFLKNEKEITNLHFFKNVPYPYKSDELQRELMAKNREIDLCMECSAKKLSNISEVFYQAQKLVLYPLHPLYSVTTKMLTPAAENAAAIPADTYKEVIDKTKQELQSLVNRTMAMHQLLTSKQGERDWMNFIKDLEDKAHVLNFNTVPYKQDTAVKDAAISGMSDRKLKEKALAEDPDLAEKKPQQEGIKH